MCTTNALDIRFMLHKDKTSRLMKLPLNIKVCDVKSMLCEDSNIPFEECEIIFCGKAMQDDKTLNEYTLSSQTTLHVVSYPRIKDEELISRQQYYVGRNSYLTGIWPHRQHTHFPFIKLQNYLNEEKLCSKHPQFYVYCKHTCFKVTPGKLRVQCANCKEDSIILQCEPEQWSDVLQAGKIFGQCYSEECGGDVCDAEFYFKCSVCRSPAPSETAVSLPNVISNIQDVLCLTCLDSCNPVVTFPCSPEHVMCLPCFEEYSRTKLRDRQMIVCENIGYSVTCPMGCEGSFMCDTHLFHILGADEYQMYQAFSAEECLIRKMKGMICPNPKCGTGLFPDIPAIFENNTKITCSNCGHMFCSNCRESYHGTSDCESQFPLLAGSSVMVRDYFESIKTIREISKNCPNCKVPTERSGGCMHMTCKMCLYEWCWNCLTRWNYNCQADHWFN
uniref:E3 ubiquitin-protein ligase parkin-like n=1 Tax=Styela clava TaxID=7725 RepID=UPI00193ACA66|nr:E3 ubiquitin-protein ligase parkin-like [Styela clava]